MTVHPEIDPVRPLHTGPARDINIAPGEALPPLVHHSFHSGLGADFGRFRPVGHRLFMNKPSGGLLAHPAELPEGVWRPWPHRSTWTGWCETEEMDHCINYQIQAKVHLPPGTAFAVIDSAADARALAQACPMDEDPHFAMLKQEMLGRDGDVAEELGDSPFFAHHIDFTRLRDYGLTGFYLTERGQEATRFPERGTPSLYGWDMPTVWLCEPHYTLSKPWRSRFIGAWPHLTMAQWRREQEERERRLTAEMDTAEDAAWQVTPADEEETGGLSDLSAQERQFLAEQAEAGEDDQDDESEA